MTIDIILTQPNNVPFPLWSKWLLNNAQRFQTIYIALHQKNMPGYDFTDLIHKMFFPLTNVVWIDGINPMDGSDWRSAAINACLEKSTAENVLFMEQDFFIKDSNEFFTYVNGCMNKSIGIPPVVGFFQGERYHPAFLCVKRSEIEKTSKDFSSIDIDHFGKFTRELREHRFFDIQEKWSPWFHMNGLTQNYTLAQQGLPPNHDIANFLLYNRKARECVTDLAPWEMTDRFVDLTFKAEKLLSPLSDYLGEYV